MSRETIYFDWARGKVTALMPDENIRYFASLRELVKYAGQHRYALCGESTFESFDLLERQAVIGLADSLKVPFWTTPNRQTARHRRELGLEKSDENDVVTIRDYALTHPHSLKKPEIVTLRRVPAAEDPDRRVRQLAKANDELMRLRRTVRMVPNGSKLGFKMTTAKDDYANKLISEALPLYSDLNAVTQAAWGNGQVYSLTLVAAVGKATKHSENRRDFDRITGMNAHGYPSQIRSDLHHWRWRYLDPRNNSRSKVNGAITLSEYRREVRRMYHELAKRRDLL